MSNPESATSTQSGNCEPKVVKRVGDYVIVANPDDITHLTSLCQKQTQHNRQRIDIPLVTGMWTFSPNHQAEFRTIRRHESK
jgi:hypothetical protein